MSEEIDRTWPYWTDILGQTIYPGDYIAVGTINGRSPQLVIAQVERINRINSRNEEITGVVWENGHRKTIPSCSITARPIKDARDFHRWSGKAGEKTRAVTYQIPENAIKIQPPREVE